MSKFERLLVPGNSEMPDCSCGTEMRLTGSAPTETSPGTEIKTYECSACGHQLRLFVWTNEKIQAVSNTGM
jgi:hypothetical protein